MNKDNIFKSSNFHMDIGDVCHVLIKDLTGVGITISLNDGKGEQEDSEDIVPTLLPLLDYDGNEYTTIEIGSQEWIIENLRVTHYSNGNAISNLTADGDWLTDVNGAYCWYNNDIGYKEPYGALYNWYAVDNVNELVYFTRGGIQETGWKIPTNTELQSLINYFGGDTIAGGPLKEIGNIHWDANIGATNSSGLTFVGAGDRNQADGSFEFIKEMSYYWSNNEQDIEYAYHLNVNHANIHVEVAPYCSKIRGVSVRCVRDIP